MYAGIEAGGTKFVCAVGEGPDQLYAIERFPTTTPAETFERAVAFFRAQDVVLKSLGIASFGPLDPHTDSPTYGYITSTPKPYWHMTDFARPMGEALSLPVVFDTDVNGAALAEYRWGAGQGLRSVLYLTVGTGIGGGAVINGQRLQGLLHPEMGHLRINRKPGDPFAGNCPYHIDCLEGMATGPAIEARVGQPAYELPPEHEAWDYEAFYLAMALTTNPGLHLLVQQGYYDMATPIGATRFDVNSLSIPAEARGRIHMRYYEAGHMMYLHEPSLEQYRRDLAEFIRETDQR